MHLWRLNSCSTSAGRRPQHHQWQLLDIICSMCSRVQKSQQSICYHRRSMDNERRSIIFLLQKTAVVTLPGVSCGVLHLKEDIEELDKIQRRARKTSSNIADWMTDYEERLKRWNFFNQETRKVRVWGRRWSKLTQTRGGLGKGGIVIYQIP